MEAMSYQPNPMTTVQCPRCGISLDLPLVEAAPQGIEYVGVCTSPLEGAGRCGTTLRLEAWAHVFALSA